MYITKLDTAHVLWKNNQLAWLVSLGLQVFFLHWDQLVYHDSMYGAFVLVLVLIFDVEPLIKLREIVFWQTICDM